MRKRKQGKNYKKKKISSYYFMPDFFSMITKHLKKIQFLAFFFFLLINSKNQIQLKNMFNNVSG